MVDIAKVCPALCAVIARLRRLGCGSRSRALESPDVAGATGPFGLVLIGAGTVLLAIALGVMPTDLGINGSRMMPVIMGLLLIACGIQVGEWVGANGRLSNILGSIVATCMAVMFAWVAINGDAPNFYGGMSAGRAAVAFNSPTVLARILFAGVATLAGLASLWGWKRVFRSR